jgi:hypothetical protein
MTGGRVGAAKTAGLFKSGHSISVFLRASAGKPVVRYYPRAACHAPVSVVAKARVDDAGLCDIVHHSLAGVFGSDAGLLLASRRVPGGR